MAKEKVKIVQDKQAPIATGIIAASIVEIAEGMKKLNSTRLTRRAITALIHENSGVSKSMINVVLDNLESLEDTWLKRR